MSLLRQVVVYSRKGCHLCEIVKETLIKLQRRGGFTWSEVDVDSDDELRRRWPGTAAGYELLGGILR